MSGFYEGYWDEYHREPVVNETPRMCMHRSGMPAERCAICGDGEVLKLMDALAKAEAATEVQPSSGMVAVPKELAQKLCDGELHRMDELRALL